MKKCTECRAPVRRTTRERHHYTECGLNNVFLAGIPVYTCTECETEFVSIPSIAGLHEALALSVAEKSSRLTADEVRFARSWLDTSNAQFAAAMGVSVGQASRWASGTAPMSLTAEHLLRSLIVMKIPQINEVEILGSIGDEALEQPYSIVKTGKGWLCSRL